jgi:hypothetical protein
MRRASSLVSTESLIARYINDDYSTIIEVGERLDELLAVQSALNAGQYDAAIEMASEPLRTHIANVSAVAGELASVGAISDDLATVAGSDTDIALVADHIDGTLSTAITDIIANLVAIQNASANATTASDSAAAALVSETNALNYKNNAEAAQTAAETAEANAVTAQGLAETAQINAETAETNAEIAQGVAEAARDAAQLAETNAAASADFVDDLFLGAKSVEPAVDNDGDTLQVGAMYYDTAIPGSEQVKIWDGTQWNATVFNTSGAVTSFNGREGAVTLLSTDVDTALGFTAVELTKSNVDALGVNAATVNNLTVETAVPADAVFTDTVYNPAAVETLTNKTLDDYTNKIKADAVHMRVKNQSGVVMLKGTVVSYFGYSDTEDAVKVVAANNTTGVAIGILAEELGVDEFGMAIANGIIDGLDTSAYTNGTILYTNTTGGLTDVAPATGFAQPIAYVLKSNANIGVLQVLAAYPKQDAGDVRYDGTASGLTSTTVQDAIDELDTAIGAVTGATDLTYASSTRLLESSTGTDVTLPEVIAAGDSGLMTGADKTKLDGIASGAEVNDVNTTLQGNTFNGNSQLVQTTADGKLPALDGSLLTGVSSVGSINDLTDVDTTTSTPTNGQVLVWSTDEWVPGDVSTGTKYTKTIFTATASQTNFTVSYDVNYVDVYRNGILLDSTDYTSTSGTEIVLATGADVGDIITVIAWDTLEIADVYTKAESDLNYEPKDATILKDADIGSTVQAYDADTAKTDIAQTFTVPQRSSFFTLSTSSGDIEFALGQHFIVTPTANITITNPVDTASAVGQSGIILITASTYSVAWGTYWKFDSDAAPDISGVCLIPYLVKSSTSIVCGNPISGLVGVM